MRQGIRRLLAAVLALVLLVLGLLLTVTQWLPRLAGIWLPPETRIVLAESPGWRNGGLWLPDVRYRVKACELAAVSSVSLSRQAHRWRLQAGRVTLNSDCISQLPAEQQPGSPRTLAQWQSLLPGADIHLQQLTVTPWQQYAGTFDLRLDKAQQQLRYRGDNLIVRATLRGQQLSLHQLTVANPLLPQPVTLSGELELPPFANGLPLTGSVRTSVTLSQYPSPLDIALSWRRQQGLLRIQPRGESTPLLSLPWQASASQIRFEQGAWRWPLAAQPLAGRVSLTLDNWRGGLDAMRIQGRLNLLTQGRGGKGNLVLSLGPGKLSVTASALPFQLTGESKLAALQLYGSIPGIITGPLRDPSVVVKPGALLRLRGRLLSTLEVDEARWPLAGIAVSSRGIHGRLQAILHAHDPGFGRFTLHLDGRASDFWPDAGRWNWRYWGEGVMAPLHANWDVKGTGSWHNTLIELSTLSTGFDRLQYGLVKVNKPRLTLTTPVRWQRSPQRPAFSGAFKLLADRTDLSNGGWLPPSTLGFQVKGDSPGRFLWRGQLRADEIGPLRVQGRWDGERLRGTAWWPLQPLTVFQPLLSPDLKMKIRSGELQAQAAFSAASDQGFEAGGHWTVKQGSVRTPDSEINGVDFSLPFRLKNDQWQLGVRGPVSLRIAEVRNQFAMQHISADLQGYYPWSEQQPLRLSNVNLGLLDGNISLSALRLPQHEVARIVLRDISLSKLITALKPKQIALSGKINGELPLWIHQPRWLVEKGWVANQGPLTLRMDKDMADAIAGNNFAAGTAINWLRYMEISRARATLDLDTLGNLTLQSQVSGTSRFSNRDQSVNLNYRHQENLFQLWRSLRYGDNLQSRVEEKATLPLHKDPKP